MNVDDDYLKYPMRRHGYDHDRYQWNMLAGRAAVSWPQGKRLAVWVNLSLQFYPLNQRGVPFKVPNGMTMPYPDLRHFSLRDYGNRVGVFRVLKAFAQLAEQNPYLLNRLASLDGEFICHGWNMDHLHYGGQDQEQEASIVHRSVSTLRILTGKPVRGWLSPARSQSWITPDLLTANGIEYCCDWVNDDMPYTVQTQSGDLMMMPLSSEIEDQFVIGQNLHSEDSWVEQVKDAFDYLLAESKEQGGRILALSIHPWLLGQPHRIGCLEEVLSYICDHPDVWQAPAGEILDHFNTRQVGGES
jgi:peptidoglycan/xylan/chitin deacetylase (PgdA/CDA1 family)